MQVLQRKSYYSDKFGVVTDLEAGFEQIRSEFLAVATEQLYSDWPEKFLYNEGWNVFGLRFMRTDLPEAHRLCPYLSSLILKHDDLISTAGFSILNPGTIIYPHVGYTDSVLRCHLGIDVPEGDCHLVVDDIKLSWESGSAFIFDDTFMHHAWNMTDKKRIILLLDLEKDILLNV